jgi:hypothetical protein
MVSRSQGRDIQPVPLSGDSGFLQTHERDLMLLTNEPKDVVFLGIPTGQLGWWILAEAMKCTKPKQVCIVGYS